MWYLLCLFVVVGACGPGGIELPDTDEGSTKPCACEPGYAPPHCTPDPLAPRGVHLTWPAEYSATVFVTSSLQLVVCEWPQMKCQVVRSGITSLRPQWETRAIFVTADCTEQPVLTAVVYSSYYLRRFAIGMGTVPYLRTTPPHATECLCRAETRYCVGDCECPKLINTTMTTGDTSEDNSSHQNIAIAVVASLVMFAAGMLFVCLMWRGKMNRMKRARAPPNLGCEEPIPYEGNIAFDPYAAGGTDVRYQSIRVNPLFDPDDPPPCYDPTV